MLPVLPALRSRGKPKRASCRLPSLPATRTRATPSHLPLHDVPRQYPDSVDEQEQPDPPLDPSAELDAHLALPRHKVTEDIKARAIELAHSDAEFEALETRIDELETKLRTPFTLDQLFEAVAVRLQDEPDDVVQPHLNCLLDLIESVRQERRKAGVPVQGMTEPEAQRSKRKKGGRCTGSGGAWRQAECGSGEGRRGR